MNTLAIRNGKPISGHKNTAARRALAALRAEATGNKMLANQLWASLPTIPARTSSGQRKARKARRQAFAAGNRHAFN